MPRRAWLFVLLVGLALASLSAAGPPEKARTKAVVVGTIHQRHGTNPNYTYPDIVRILATFNPDLVCVEIRPKDFRKVPYLKEMMLATIWGLSHGKAVAPIDWWDDTENVREVRDKLAREPEYVEKAKKEEALCRESPVVRRFEEKYGPADKENVWSKSLGYEFWNGRDYNEFYTEVYRISMQVYGDSPFNLYYQTRNARMMDLILKAVKDHHSRRVIVLTGAEHKHAFDAAFAKERNVELVDFASLLPLKHVALEPAIVKDLEEDDDSPYYEPGFPKDIDANYRMKLVPLVHGPDMDVFPDKVPAANIEKAATVISRWEAAKPGSAGLTFERAWLDFLRGDYDKAIDRFLTLTPKINNGTIQDPFLRVESFANLGRCYDLLGRRAEALDSYARAEDLLVGTPRDGKKAYILQNYKEVPFRLQKKKAASITAATGPGELIETGGAGVSFALTEAEYRKLAGQLAAMPAFVPMTKKPDGLSPRARFGVNFVIGGRNLTWAIDGDDSAGYTLTADLNADGDLGNDAPYHFELVDGKYTLRLSLTAKATGSGETYPVAMKLVIDRIAPPGSTTKQLALLNYHSNRRRGEFALEPGAPSLLFTITGSNGLYDEDYDSIAFDLDHDGAFDPKVERYMISEKYVNIGDATYEFTVDHYGRSVTLTRLAEKRPGRVILKPGYPAPDFAFTDLQGNARRLSDFRGQAVLLDFWGTWCGPCVASVPGLVAAYGKYHDRGFEILGIAAGDTPEKLAAFMSEKGMRWAQTIEGDKGPIATLYRVAGWPSYFLVGRDGQIIAAAPNGEKIDLAAELAKLFPEKQPL